MANVESRIKRIQSQTFKLPNVELNEGRIKRDKSVHIFEVQIDHGKDCFDDSPSPDKVFSTVILGLLL